MCSWHLYLVLPEVHSCPPATGVVGIFAPFHAVSAEVSSSFPVLARLLLTKFLTISGKAPVSRVVISSTDQPWTLVKVFACLELPFIVKGKLSFSFQ